LGKIKTGLAVGCRDWRVAAFGKIAGNYATEYRIIVNVQDQGAGDLCRRLGYLRQNLRDGIAARLTPGNLLLLARGFEGWPILLAMGTESLSLFHGLDPPNLNGHY